MPRSLSLGALFGTQVRVHISWPIAAAIITTAFALSILPDRNPDWNAGQLWLAGATICASLAVSVLIHELAHVVVARRFGMAACSITLFLFGGISEMAGDVTRPRTELLIALAGPLTSLGIGLLAALAYTAVQAGEFTLVTPPGGATLLPVLLYYVALTNVVLGIFNLVPAFPLDGGRVLAAVLWVITGDRRRAIGTSSLMGQLAAAALITYGSYHLIFASMLSGLWLIGLGVFLMEAAVGAGGRELERPSEEPSP